MSDIMGRCIERVKEHEYRISYSYPKRFYHVNLISLIYFAIRESSRDKPIFAKPGGKEF